MNTVESFLRSWAGQLRNGAYQERVLRGANEIKRLEAVNADLLAACETALDRSRLVEGGLFAVSDATLAAVRVAVAKAKGQS